jgi:pentose-5-phosphate-3-epimerase
MSDSIEIIPTVVPKDAGEFADAVAAVKGFAGSIHLDVGDGVFTSAISWPYAAPGEFTQPGFALEALPTEAHLMAKDPRGVGVALAQRGIARVIGHIEAFGESEMAREALASWRSCGAEAGISILADTPLEMLDPVAASCDVIQVMSVATIGAQGAPFDHRAFARVGELRAKYPGLLIAVDGGVSIGSIAELTRLGARRFAVGSAIMKSGDPAHAYVQLRSLAEHAIQ